MPASAPPLTAADREALFTRYLEVRRRGTQDEIRTAWAEWWLPEKAEIMEARAAEQKAEKRQRAKATHA